jgi:hypothetical protein
VVANGLVTLLAFTHCATVHGRKVPSTISVNVLEPAAMVIVDAVAIVGAGRLVPGVVIVNATVFDGPDAFDTETPAVPGNAASWGKIEAVSWLELPNVARGEPFQLTTDEPSKFEPVTVSMNPAGLQYGVEAIDVVDAESEVTVGARPGLG